MTIRQLLRELSSLLLAATAGCATILSSGPDPVRFRSEPQGADVYVNGQRMGATPLTLHLRANKEYLVSFQRDGYNPATVGLTTHVQAGWVLLDLLYLPAVVVDAATGEWKAFDSNDHFTQLQPLGVLPPTLSAQFPLLVPGGRVRVWMPTCPGPGPTTAPCRIIGILIPSPADTIGFVPSERRDSVFVPLQGLFRLERDAGRKSAFWTGAAIGTGAGALIAAVIGAAVIEEPTCTGAIGEWCIGKDFLVAVAAANGALGGGVLGGVVGALVGKTDWKVMHLKVTASPGASQPHILLLFSAGF